MEAALRGLRVLDLCRSYPPAFASMFLGDFGADVIKIDTPGFSFPLKTKGGIERFAAFYPLDRNKRSILLNLKAKNGREIFLRLAESADVIIENSKPGTMEKLGIGYRTIKNVNSRIIYCSVSGFGQDGPYKLLPGHDSNYLGISGALGIIGEKNGPPITPSNLIGDMAGGGLHSLAAILVALIARQKTGKGQFIDISYTDAVFSLLAFETAFFLLTGVAPRRGETPRTGAEPWYASYKTKDGRYFNIGCAEHRLWENLCRALGCEQFIAFQWEKDDEKREEMFSFFRKIFLTKTRDEWWEWAKDKEIAASPVLDLEESFNDPQIIHRKMLLNLDHPKIGKVKQTGFPLRLSETPCEFRNFSPIPGQHTREILDELGYSKEEIASFKELGIIGTSAD